VHQAVVLVGRVPGDALPVESREQRGRAGSVKAFVVIEDANPQTCTPLCRRFELPELLSIKGLAQCVKHLPPAVGADARGRLAPALCFHPQRKRSMDGAPFNLP